MTSDSRIASLVSQIRGALSSRTGRDTQLVFSGQIVSAALGFGINLLLLRKLSVDDYALFSLFFSLLMLLAGFMHLGWIETFVRFGAKAPGPTELSGIEAYARRNTLLASALIGTLAALLAPWLAANVYERPDFARYIRMAALGGFVSTAFTFVQNSFRARRKFKGFFYTQVFSTALRGALLLGLLFTGALALSSAAWSHIVSLAFFSLPFFLSLIAPLAGISPGTEERREMKRYNRWLLVSLFATNIIGNIDSHIIAHYRDNFTLSGFSAASKLTLPIQFVISALTTTLLPRLSASRDIDEIRRYLKHLRLFLIPMLLAVVVSIWAAPPLLIALAGQKYADIGGLIQLQILTMLIVLAANPIGLVLYAWGHSERFAYLNLVQLGVDLVLDLWWIPRYGAYGAISATLAVNLLGMVYIYYSVFSQLRDRKF